MGVCGNTTSAQGQRASPDRRTTAADEAAGRLVPLHPLAVERPQGMYLVRHASRGDDPRLALFVDWLRQQAITAA